MKKKMNYVNKKELDNALKVDGIDYYSTAKTLSVFEELEDLTNLFLNRNNDTIEQFRMQKAF